MEALDAFADALGLDGTAGPLQQWASHICIKGLTAADTDRIAWRLLHHHALREWNPLDDEPTTEQHGAEDAGARLAAAKQFVQRYVDALVTPSLALFHDTATDTLAAIRVMDALWAGCCGDDVTTLTPQLTEKAIQAAQQRVHADAVFFDGHHDVTSLSVIVFFAMLRDADLASYVHTNDKRMQALNPDALCFPGTTPFAHATRAMGTLTVRVEHMLPLRWAGIDPNPIVAVFVSAEAGRFQLVAHSPLALTTRSAMLVAEPIDIPHVPQGMLMISVYDVTTPTVGHRNLMGTATVPLAHLIAHPTHTIALTNFANSRVGARLARGRHAPSVTITMQARVAPLTVPNVRDDAPTHEHLVVGPGALSPRGPSSLLALKARTRAPASPPRRHGTVYRHHYCLQVPSHDHLRRMIVFWSRRYQPHVASLDGFVEARLFYRGKRRFIFETDFSVANAQDRMGNVAALFSSIAPGGQYGDVEASTTDDVARWVSRTSFRRVSLDTQERETRQTPITSKRSPSRATSTRGRHSPVRASPARLSPVRASPTRSARASPTRPRGTRSTHASPSLSSTHSTTSSRRQRRTRRHSRMTETTIRANRRESDDGTDRSSRRWVSPPCGGPTSAPQTPMPPPVASRASPVRATVATERKRDISPDRRRHSPVQSAKKLSTSMTMTETIVVPELSPLERLQRLELDLGFIPADVSSCNGVRVANVSARGMAVQAFLVEGDIITHVNDTPVFYVGALRQALLRRTHDDDDDDKQPLLPGDTFTLRVRRRRRMHGFLFRADDDDVQGRGDGVCEEAKLLFEMGCPPPLRGVPGNDTLLTQTEVRQLREAAGLPVCGRQLLYRGLALDELTRLPLFVGLLLGNRGIASQYGVRVRRVIPHGPAAAAGLHLPKQTLPGWRVGLFIDAVDGMDIGNRDEFGMVLRQNRCVGDGVSLRVVLVYDPVGAPDHRRTVAQPLGTMRMVVGIASDVPVSHVISLRMIAGLEAAESVVDAPFAQLLRGIRVPAEVLAQLDESDGEGMVPKVAWASPSPEQQQQEEENKTLSPSQHHLGVPPSLSSTPNSTPGRIV